VADRTGWLAVLVALAAAPALVAAQGVRGTIVDRASGVPISGVVVILLGRGDTAVARALSDSRGEFRLTARAAGSYRVHTLRIGFRAVMSDAFELSRGAEINRVIRVESVPFVLDTIRVVDRNVCRSRASSDAASAIWEQARTALIAAQITARQPAVEARVLRFDRTHDARSSRVLEQTTSVATGATTAAWASLPADQLRRGGYVVDDAEGYTHFYAPDVEVLLSSEFQADHCFRLSTRATEGLVGLWFEPTRERGRTPDIKGTIWLDLRTSALRRLEFRYANVSDAQEDAGAGGQAEFVRMRNGGFAISRWSIAMPLIEPQQTSRTSMGVAMRLPDRVVAMRLTGGELVSVVVARDTMWVREPLVLTGTVTDSSSGSRVANAVVTLAGTGFAGMTDGRGRFAIAGVLPGEYVIQVRTPSLDSVNTVHQATATITDASADITLKVARADELLRAVCVGDRTPARGAPAGVLLGVARLRGDTLPPRNVEVIAEWTEVQLRSEPMAIVAERPIRYMGTRTDARGVFRFCGLPMNATVLLRATSDSVDAAPVEVRIASDARFTRTEVVFDRVEGRGATFMGSVLIDSTQQPIVEAEVSLPGLTRSMLTDDQGRFRFNELPAGEHRVLVRRMGYGRLDTTLTLAAARTVSRRVYLEKVTVLDTVSVAAVRLPQSFEEHRRLGLGAFLTRADLDRLDFTHLDAVLATLPGVRIVSTGSYSAFIATNRVQKADRHERADGSGFATNCLAHVYVDHMLVYSAAENEPRFDLRSISPEQVEAIEWYSSRLKFPPEYGVRATICGILVIHTRRRHDN